MKRLLTFPMLGIASLSVGQSLTENYVKTSTMLDSNRTDSVISVQYYDGLGRPTQKAIGGMNTQGKFLHTLDVYDALGNVVQSWCPVVGSTSPDVMSDTDLQSASSTDYDCDTYGYSAMTYDLQGRPTSVHRPGAAWQNRRQTITRTANKANDVKWYVFRSEQLAQQGYYPQCALLCETTTDEDSHKVETFTDVLGRTVLERRAGNVCTYYVYDEIGQLRLVLQPMYQMFPNLANYAFQYRYDDLGRVASKTLPGCDSVSYEYDGLTNRVIKMQDGLLRVNGRTRKFEYDGLGRLTKQSIAAGNTVLYDEIRNFYDDYSFLDKMEYRYMVPDNDVDDTDLTPNSSQNGIGQLTGTWQRASNGEAMLATFNYDEYGRQTMRKEIGLGKHLSIKAYDYNFAGDLKYEGHDIYTYDSTSKKIADNPCYGWVTHKFDNTHTKLPTSSVIHFTDGDNNMCNAIGTYAYDDFGNIVRKSRSGAVADMTYEYDNLHGWVKRIASSGGFEQKLYRETEGNEPRFNGSISAMTWKVASNGRLRRFDYEYDGMNRLWNAEYGYYGHWDINDNSSVLELISNCGGEHENYSVQYWYDKNSNLTSIYRQGRLSFGDYDGYDTVEDDYIEYDGNQVVSYNPWACGDPYYSNFDFVNGVDEDVEYLYDANGNLTQDKNKGLTFEYDLLGHPVEVSGSNNDIEYVYAADGRKLRTTYKTYTSTTKKTVKTSSTKDYINNYIFTNGKASMFSFDGGYYTFDAQGALNGCHYYIADYQGNNRMVVNASTNRTEQVTHYYPYGELMADISTSPDAQQFKYSGKELDRSFGLDLYDFHARQQDAKLGRFTSIDPLAEKYYGISPYAYCGGDPVNCVDPDGRKLKGVNNEFVSIDTKNWNLNNANPDTNKLWNIAKKTETGRKLFQAVIDCSTTFSVCISDEIELNADKPGTLIFGSTTHKEDGTEAITIYQGSTEANIQEINAGTSLGQVRKGISKDIPVTVDEVMTGTLLHEFVHGVDDNSNSRKNPGGNVEEKPKQEENNFHKELDSIKRKELDK